MQQKESGKRWRYGGEVVVVQQEETLNMYRENIYSEWLSQY